MTLAEVWLSPLQTQPEIISDSNPNEHPFEFITSDLRLSPQQTQSAASQQPDGHGGFVAASLTCGDDDGDDDGVDDDDEIMITTN